MIIRKGIQERSRRYAALASLILFLLCCIIGGCDGFLVQNNAPAENLQMYFPPVSESDAQMEIHIIDVGQGDCALVRSGGANILVDAGENGLGSKVVEYLKSIGITKLDWVIGTHPHSDHIGGLDTVISKLDVDNIMMPRLPDELVPINKTYTDVLDAVEKKGLQITAAKAGDVFTFGDMAMQVLSPSVNSNYSDVNDYSVVLRFVCGDFEYLTTGDISSMVEIDIIDNGYDVSADILKLAHHGSYTGTCRSFLNAVNPMYAVIMCGHENEHGHPHDAVMDRIYENKISPIRTDRLGNVKIVCNDGVIDVYALD